MFTLELLSRQRLIGWLELQEMIDIYHRSVFSTAAIKKLLPQHYDELLYRLHHTLQHCVSTRLFGPPSKRFEALQSWAGIRSLNQKLNTPLLNAESISDQTLYVKSCTSMEICTCFLESLIKINVTNSEIISYFQLETIFQQYWLSFSGLLGQPAKNLQLISKYCPICV